jgi:GTP-binding protein YchF
VPIGIIGLPHSGKTTVFNGVTRGHADTSPFKSGGLQPNIGTVKVPDSRLEALARISNPKRIVPAEVEYIDIPGSPDGFGKAQGIGGEQLNVLQRCDALMLVVRGFQDPSVPHIESTIDPYRDITNMELELAFSDLSILERREQRIQSTQKSAKSTERDSLLKELALVQQIRTDLESEIPVRQQSLPPEAKPILDNFQLLTAKPLLVLMNIDETDLAETAAIESEMDGRLPNHKVEKAALCGKLEMELAGMPEEEEMEFRESMNAGEPGLNRMVRLSYRLLGLISFLTTGEDETRAWTITQGTIALDAAAKIHSDIQRGFIRAEIVGFNHLVESGSLQEARRQGALRSEGKTYVIQDGDVVNYLFNV